MTVPRLKEITEYWSVVPPLHEAFAGFVGAFGKHKPASSSTPDGSNDEDALMKDLVAMGFQIPDGILD